MTVNSLWLNTQRRALTSQYGEDGVIEAIFEKIGEESRWCCEFGAWDGLKFSNTFNLIEKGWSSIQIEASSEKYAELIKNMEPYKHRVQCVRASVTAGGNTSLDVILKRGRVPALDLLSIDVDGDDYHIWKGLKDYLPRIVIIEVNSSFDPTVDMIPGSMGSSVKSMVELGKEKGYELALHTGNCIFVRKEYCGILGIDSEDWPLLFDKGWIISSV